MLRNRVCVVLAFVLSGLAWSAGIQAADGDGKPRLSDARIRTQRARQMEIRSEAAKRQAWDTAKRQGWADKTRTVDPDGRVTELMAIEDGRVLVLSTNNVNAAISTAASQIRNVSPYHVNGSGVTIGIWDGGAVRSTHQEFGSRVTIRDGGSADDHATHVGGTIGAAGVDASALGMAPAILIDSYEWTNDVGEMTARAMALPGEAGTIQASNHSYGYIVGWYGTRWYGTYPEREDRSFGQYSSYARDYDILCYDAPYFLPFKSAGNDRSDTAPSSGTSFEYYSGSAWVTKTYDPATDPYNDGWDNGGFDTVGHIGNAKNIMTVGAVNDAVSGGVRSPAAATMSTFSCWGPTDDGRVKPDIVANGVGLYSSLSGSDSSYGTYSGTSMSSPNASGSAMLLVDYYGQRLPGQYMRASMLKGLIIHTADDLDNPGPDYRTGWGLMNVKAAADHIGRHADSPGTLHMVEGRLATGQTSDGYELTWDGEQPIRATLCWTDPPATAVSELDDPSARLINDLDLRIIGPGGSTTYLPFVLDPSNPAATATTGDNIRDNVEQIRIASPGPGSYTIIVSHKGVLTNGEQYYSLLLSGFNAGPAGTVQLDRSVYNCSVSVAVTVVDGDLVGQGSQAVTLATSGGDQESLVLTEDPPGSGAFHGTIQAVAGNALSGDQLLQVGHGQTLTVTYQDLDDGSGQPATVQDTATIDCVAPVIFNVAVAEIMPRQATITFETNEPAAGLVRYGTSCGHLVLSRGTSTPQTFHQVVLSGLDHQTDYFFQIEATDTGGNLTIDNQGGACYAFTTPPQPDYFSELFTSEAPNDLSYKEMTFVPDDSSDYYAACTGEATAFPVDPTGGTTLSLTDDSYQLVSLSGGAQVQLYGVGYSSFYVCSNGSITLGAGDTTWQESPSAHFSQPRISGWFDDFNPAASGTVSHQQLADRAVVTYQNVPEWGQTTQNSFQIEMFFDGAIRLTFLGMAAVDGMVGLSAGAGLPDDYLDSDLSDYGSCWHPADLDHDGDVDLDDYAILQTCRSGWGIPQEDPACQSSDLNSDLCVDTTDAWLIRGCISGADIAPDPECLP